jgi:hypothetical protein
MKKITLLFIYLIAALQIYAQLPVVLNFESHAIKSESNNSMQLCKYIEPGEGGENIIWDFSGIETTNDFIGYVRSAYHSVNSQIFPRANTELDEFNNRFYFRIAYNRIEQVGYTSQDNLVVTAFDKPFVKMIFPFTMGDHFEGTFSGSYKMGTLSSDIKGNYEVLADGYGMLILPGNFVIENTLRVRTMKNYSYEMSGSGHLFEIVTYRWYCDWYRYPLLVLTQIKSAVNESTTVAYQAAFNNQLSIPANLVNEAISTDHLFEIYPNPTNKSLSISYSIKDEGRVWFGLFDLSGKEIKVLFDQDMDAGTYHLESKLVDEGLPEGTYLLKADIAGQAQTQQIVLVK